MSYMSFVIWRLLLPGLTSCHSLLSLATPATLANSGSQVIVHMASWLTAPAGPNLYAASSVTVSWTLLNNGFSKIFLPQFFSFLTIYFLLQVTN